MNFKLPNYSNAELLIIGDVMLDRYWNGDTGRISPEAPVPVVKINHSEERPGGAANVAMNVAALGAKAHIIGVIGDDECADILNKSLTSLNVNCGFVVQPNTLTITKLRILSRNQQLMRLDFEEKFTNTDANAILAKMDEVLPKIKAVVMSDYAKGTLEHVKQYIKKALAHNILVFVDPKGTNFEPYRGATLLTPNMKEFEAVVGHVNSEEDLVAKGLSLIKQFDLGGLLVTRSEHGMTLLRIGHRPFHLATRAKEVFDVTGAGDTVISTLAASVSAGASFEDACILANAAAGLVVGKLGTSTLSEIELAEEIHGREDINSGVLSESALLEAVKTARDKGETIVMTNGCFDILHAGHVSYLNNAAKLGDRLIVAVNSDDSVKRLKGSTRPINSLDRRMAVLAGLGAVDWVISFAEETPKRLIAKVLPDLLVKGGDYKPEDIAGGAEVIAAGGEVRILNFEDGVSTTDIIKIIKGEKNNI